MPHQPPLERSNRDDAARHRLAWGTWPADLSTPVRAFLALRERRRGTCLLESVEGPARLSRYSFVGVDPTASFRGRRDSSRLRIGDDERLLSLPMIQAFREARTSMPAPRPPRGLPPFSGGWIGALTYEWSSALEPRVPRAANDVWELPDAMFEHYADVVAFDHAAQKLYVLALAPRGAEDFERAQARIDSLIVDATREPRIPNAIEFTGPLEACTEPDAYRAGVERLKHEIRRGEIFQAVLSQRFERPFLGDPFTLYRVLRLTNPSPHMFFFENDELAFIGSSPERLVSTRAGRVEGRPIAGTRPRGKTPEEDDRLARELAENVKERAEHDMLVDLARNDLGRVARIGSVRVAEHRVIERFARVQHLVSRVECELANGCDSLDALVASFPAGTVSGAPKVRAQELIAEIERDTRGPYAGAFGYWDGESNLDLALSIRTFFVRGGRLSVQAGAGVVFDSDPEREFQETLDKAKALFEAAELATTSTFAVPTEKGARA